LEEVKNVSSTAISRMLKYYRKLNGFSVKDVANLLSQQKHPIAEKTIYGWESGQTQPGADNFILLCELYHIDNVIETLKNCPQDNTAVIPTAFERELILRYRELPEYQAAIHRLLGLDKE